MPSVLLPCVVSFLLGLWLGSYIRLIPISIITILVFCAGGLTWCERRAKLTSPQSLMLFACLLFGVGYWNIAEWRQSPSVLLDHTSEGEVLLVGVIGEPVQHAPGRMMMLVDAIAIGEGPNRQVVQGKLRLTWRNPNRPLYQGDTIQVRTRVREPFGTRNPGGFDYGAYLRQHGIEAVAMVRGPDRITTRSPGMFEGGLFFWNQIDRWRDQVRQAVLSNLSDPARGLFLGMIVGEQSYIDQEVRDDFMTTGTVHIISISGSHLGLLAFLSFFSVRGLTRRMPVYWLEWLSCRIIPKQLAVVLTIPLVVFYTLLSGAHVATVRSLIMIILYLLAVWLGHERQILIALGVSALIATVFNPMVIYDLSFQLSYVSVLAIAMALNWTKFSEEEEANVTPAKEKLKKWASQYFLISCSATLATMPLVAYYFNQVAWIGVLANMVVVPFVGFVVVPLGLLSSILVLVFGLENLPLTWMTQSILDSLTALVGFLANAPGAEWHVASPSLIAIVGFYVCLMLAFRLHRPIPRLIGTAMVVVLIIWWLWSPRHLFDDNTLRTTFLDVGQGDATLLELPDGQTVLIDGGAAYDRWDMGRMVVGPYLWDRGIRTIDHLIATHPQLDHVGGLAWVVKHFDVGHFWTNGVQRDEAFYKKLNQAVREQKLDEQIAWAGQDLLKGRTCQIRSLNPPRSGLGMSQAVSGRTSGSKLNNLSIVLSVKCGSHSILLTADAEVEALERMERVSAVSAATLVKIPHHGAKSSLSVDWVNRLTARAAMVSAGQRNRYDHPAPLVLKHYEDKGIEVYRTDQDGAIVVTQRLDTPGSVIRTTTDQYLSVVNGAGNLLGQEAENLDRLWAKWIRPD